MTSMEKQQTALHFWSLTSPPCNSGCHGDPDAFGLHGAALGRPGLQRWRAGKCAPLCVLTQCAPLSVLTRRPQSPLCTAGSPVQGHRSPSPCPGVQAAPAPGTLPSHTALAPAGQGLQPLGLCHLCCATLWESPSSPDDAHRYPRDHLCQTAAQLLTLQHSYKFCYGIRYLLKQQIRRMPLIELFSNTVCCPKAH